MQEIQIDNIVPYITIGAIAVVAMFFTFYFHYVKDIVFKSYRDYLWTCFLYIVMKQMVLVPKYTQQPLFLFLLGKFLIWFSFILYIRFMYHTIDFKNKKEFFKKMLLYTQILIFFTFIFYTTIEQFFPKSKHLITYFFTFTAVYMFTAFFIVLSYLYKSKTVTYYKYLYLGSFLLLIFVFLSSFLNEPTKNFFGLTNLSILCIGWFLELFMFLVALSMKVKIEWEEKYRITQQNLENEKKLLIQEINSQRMAYESKQSERLRISVDMHDGISNAITGLKFYISDKRIQAKENSEKLLLQDIEQELNSIYIQVRNYIQKLYSGNDQQKYDIPYFLNTLNEQYKTSNLKFITKIESSDIEKKLNRHQKNELYLILTESIGNAIKHADCSLIEITIYIADKKCYFKIKDNGIGFGFDEKLNSESGLGLYSILQRIERLKGEIEFKNFEGTTISGNFPT